jgi:hypothetical protein
MSDTSAFSFILSICPPLPSLLSLSCMAARFRALFWRTNKATSHYIFPRHWVAPTVLGYLALDLAFLFLSCFFSLMREREGVY